MESTFVIDIGGSNIESESPFTLYDAGAEVSKTVDEENRDKPNGLPRNGRRLTGLKRYHEIDNLSSFKPGIISTALRRALDLSKHDIPVHIYKMRSLGYPPGWLRKARVEELPSFQNEKSEEQITTVQYRQEDFIEYPGFNVCSSKVRDDTYLLNCPKMQHHHMLENFIASLQKVQELVSPHEHTDINSLEEERQRLLDEINALNRSIVSGETIDLTENSIKSKPDNIDLVSDSSIPCEIDDDDYEEEEGVPPAREFIVDPPHQSDTSIITSPLMQLKQLSVETPSELKKNENKEVEIKEYKDVPPVELEGGTTIPMHLLKSLPDDHEPISFDTPEKVPNLEAFSNGIQPFTPYKNLPDSQGGYMRVRNTLKRVKDNPHSFELSEQTISTPVKKNADSKSSKKEEITKKERSSSSHSGHSHHRHKEQERVTDSGCHGSPIKHQNRDNYVSKSYTYKDNRDYRYDQNSYTSLRFDSTKASSYSHKNCDYSSHPYSDINNINSREHPSNQYNRNPDIPTRQHINNCNSNYYGYDNGHGYPAYPPKNNGSSNFNDRQFSQPRSNAYYR